MIKHFYILAIALRNLQNNKLKALAIALPLTLIIAIVSSVSFFLEGVKRDAMLAAGFFPDILVQQQVGGRTESLFWTRYQEVLKDIKEIDSFYPRVWGHINFSDSRNHNKTFVVMGLDPSYVNSGLMLDVAIEKGEGLKENDLGKGIIGTALARALACDLGDVIEVTYPGMREPVPVEVSGLFSTSVQIYTADLLLVPIETARRVLGFYSSDESSDIAVHLKDPALADTVAQRISLQIEGARPLTKAVMVNLTEQAFGQKSGFFYLLWLILLTNVIIIAWSLMSQISFNMQREIGILKAIGWDVGQIMELKTMETFLLGLFSVAGGLLTGVAYMRMDAPGLKKFIIGWADIYPDFPIPLHIESSTVLLIIALGTLPLLAGTLVPVWRLSIIDPDEAIKR